MKKSLLIAPALGVLVLAAAGSVGGTVAWFSSNNVWDMTASNFAITKLDGNLEAEITEGTGTKKAATGNIIHVAENNDGSSPNLLTPGSFDYASGLAFVKSGSNFIEKTEGATGTGDWLAKTKGTNQANNVFYAVSWTVAFKYTFPADTSAVNLYFNIDSSNGSVADATGETKTHMTKKGFRLAMVGSTPATGEGATYNRVWAPLADSADAPNYIQDDSENDGKGKKATYPASPSTAETKILITGNAAKPADGTATTNNLAHCIGQFNATAANATSTLTYKFVAWFEGEDANVVDDASLDSISASLKFYTLPHLAA